MDYLKKLEPHVHHYDAYLTKFRTLNRIERATGVPKVYFTLAIYVLTSISVFFHLWAGLTTSLYAVAYPTYRAFEASDKKDAENLSVWVTYFWTLSLLSIFELDTACLLNWIPFYYVVKLLFIFWLFTPGYMGAKKIHGWVLPALAPMFKRAIATDPLVKLD
ncbi:TB2/DP1, HVA22 family-domain-containing protein [Phlyctochytrium arcticum]|nr:TB2/DP1, HVA22 family-domain-containing protein [Phlyctochytrium arcticum]